MAQSIKCLTLDFSSGHDYTVCGFKPHIMQCAESAEPALDSLSPSLFAPPLLVFSLSLKINKLKKKIETSKSLCKHHLIYSINNLLSTYVESTSPLQEPKAFWEDNKNCNK